MADVTAPSPEIVIAIARRYYHLTFLLCAVSVLVFLLDRQIKDQIIREARACNAAIAAFTASQANGSAPRPRTAPRRRAPVVSAANDRSSEPTETVGK